MHQNNRVDSPNGESVSLAIAYAALARATASEWAERIYSDDEWNAHERRADALRLLDALCKPDAEGLLQVLSAECARRQRAAARKERRDAGPVGFRG